MKTYTTKSFQKGEYYKEPKSPQLDDLFDDIRLSSAEWESKDYTKDNNTEDNYIFASKKSKYTKNSDSRDSKDNSSKDNNSEDNKNSYIFANKKSKYTKDSNSEDSEYIFTNTNSEDSEYIFTSKNNTNSEDSEYIFTSKNNTNSEEDSEEDSEKNSEDDSEYSKISVKKQIKKEKFQWEPLDNIWQKKLLTNNLFVKNCEMDGNCQFRSIETALKGTSFKHTHKQLRLLIGKYINKLSKEDFDSLINNYRIEKDNGEFNGEWEPYDIKTKKQFITQIKKLGFNFEGDNITLSLLSNALDIDFIIFNNNEHSITNLTGTIPKNKLILLYYVSFNNSGHYQTIGIKKFTSLKNKVITLFNRSSLPNELEIFLDKEKLYYSHIKKIYNNLIKSPQKITLHSLYTNLSNNLVITLTRNDKKIILKILKEFLNKIFKCIKESKL